MTMVRCAGRLGKKQCSSASTSAVCMGRAKDSAPCCEKLGTAKWSSKSQKQLNNKVLQNYDKFNMTESKVLCLTEARTTMAAAHSVAVVLHLKKPDQSE